MSGRNPIPTPLAYAGVQAVNPPETIIAVRAPSTSDKKAIGTLWVNKSTQTSYQLAGYLSGVPVWIALGGGSSAIATINSNAPVAGNYVLAGTANQIAIGQTAGTSTFTIPAVFTAPGSIASTTTITAGTSLTATLGAITATNGNIVKGTAGNKDVYTSVATNATAGANSAGSVTLAGGTATIATTAVTANSLIRIYRQGIGATGAAALGILTIGTITPATSFVINSVQAADATALQASDVSVIFWEIVN